MSIPRLSPSESLLLVVDVQERLMPTLASADALATNCALLLEASAAIGVPALVTEQYPRGLGPTVEVVRRRLGPEARVFEKTRFSALTDEVAAAIGESGRRTVLVAGIEAHVCVLQTVLDLRAGGHEVFFATDAVTAGQAEQVPHAFRRMEAAGALPTSVLSATYEWMADKRHPAFAACLDVAKRIRRL